MIQNITVRVPWTDNGWCGCVCNKPCFNTDCLKLRNIYENKRPDEENEVAGHSMQGLENTIPCVAEGAAFMSPYGLTRKIVHPYKASNPQTHGHFLETEQYFPPYSVPSRPFLWMMKPDGKKERKNFEKFGVDYHQSCEPNLAFENIWVQDARNHKAIFDVFYENIKPNASLCFLYAKQVPFVDDPRRVVIAIGHIEKVIPSVEHNHTDQGELRSLSWETMVCHTIRKNGDDGFVMPYYQLMEYAKHNPKFNIKRATIFASDDYHGEYSFATEHLSYDGTIDSLIRAIQVFDYIAEFPDLKETIPCHKYKLWLEKQLSAVWDERGGFPGLGNLLYMFGCTDGIRIAEQVKDEYKRTHVSLELLLNQVFEKNARFVKLSYLTKINNEVIDAWKSLSPKRKSLFVLLSHFYLTENQFWGIFYPEHRDKYHINCTDDDIVANPYIMYEKTRSCKVELQIPVRFIDMGMFPPEKIQTEYPIAKPSVLEHGGDKRRIRAVLVDFLERQSLEGNSIYPVWMTLNDFKLLPIRPSCDINSDIIFGCREFLSNEVAFVDMKKEDGQQEYKHKAFQLNRLEKIDELIETNISKRLSRKPLNVKADWEQLLNEKFRLAKVDDDEKLARQEKIAVLENMAKARIFVLIGGAGTGKTTLLSVLCSSEEIKSDGILLLAPTGKARVKMQQAMKAQNVEAKAQTVAQYLLQSRHFDFYTMNYRLTGRYDADFQGTVIIDESSMLTEEMFGALMESLDTAKRIIFVGDPNQLPPIGTGRPFVDLVQKLSGDLPNYLMPRISSNFGELKITRRQQTNGEHRFDLDLAQWFKNSQEDLDEDIFYKIQNGECSNNLVFKQWKTEEELTDIIFETLKEELNLDNVDDIVGFNRSLGATEPKNGWQYFNTSSSSFADHWQILAPVRGMTYGVLNMNYQIQQKYRQNYIEYTQTRYSKLPRQMGDQGLIYGDKVICVKNDKREGWSRINDCINYVANGEVGIATADWKNRSYLKIAYSSQPNSVYSYTRYDFKEEGEPILELAYALTVHKSQGSEFNKVILVLSEPCQLISKELLYTAFTRQIDKIIVLYNQEAFNLRSYANPKNSAIACRFTRLFHVPSVVEHDDRYYAENLVHKTERGELVRSKSEVIIANMLYENHIPYKYEEPLTRNGVSKLPDFTVKDIDGKELYWEHCGMMNDKKYAEKWEKKKKWYLQNGIVEGENLIATYENGNGFDSSEVKRLIDKYLA